MRTVGLTLQTIGTLTLVLAVNVVRERLHAETVGALRKARAAGRRAHSWIVKTLRHWRHPHVVYSAGDSLALFDGTAAATVTMYRVDRETISERDWLAHLDHLVFALRELLDQSAKARTEELRDTHARIEKTREEVLAVTRQGWPYVVAGALLSVAGIIITAFA